MNRLATLIALVLVVSIVAAGISSASATTLVTCTVLVATGVVMQRFVLRTASNIAGVQVSSFREFVACLLQNLLRFAIGAVLIAWVTFSTLWYFGG